MEVTLPTIQGGQHLRMQGEIRKKLRKKMKIQEVCIGKLVDFRLSADLTFKSKNRRTDGEIRGRCVDVCRMKLLS